MVKKILLLFPLFYFLTLLQTSFFVPIFSFSPNLVLILIILFSLFAPSIFFGIFSALIGGFFLDIFSENFFGFHILISLAIFLFIKFFLKKYVKI